MCGLYFVVDSVKKVKFNDSQHKMILFAVLYFAATALASDICKGEPEGTLIQNEEDCSTFWHCSHDMAFLLKCPDDLYFNPDTSTCDQKENVKCPVPGPKEEEDEIECPTGGDPTKPVFFPSKLHCHVYFVCAGGQVFRLECDQNLHWNQQKETCDYPEDAGCLIGGSTTRAPADPTTPRPTPVPTTTSERPSPTERVTPVPTTAAPTTSAPTVRTTEKVEPETTARAPTSTEDPGTMLECPETGTAFLPHPSYCDRYIFCLNGVSRVQQCPFYYNFDYIERVCKVKSEARCFVL